MKKLAELLLEREEVSKIEIIQRLGKQLRGMRAHGILQVVDKASTLL